MLLENDEDRGELECFTDYINRLFLLESKQKLAIFISSFKNNKENVLKIFKIRICTCWIRKNSK